MEVLILAKEMKKQEQTPPVNTEGFLHIDEQNKRWKNFFSSGPYSSMLSAGTIGGFLMNSGSFFVDDPYLLNQRIKQLKSTAKFMEREQIENALLDIDHNEQTLREATHSALNMTYPLYRLQYLYEGILKYRSYIKPSYVSKEDMSGEKFKREWEFIDKWHKKLNPEKQFRRITAQVIPEGKKAYYVRQNYNKGSKTEEPSVDYVYFEQLPSDWYKIVKHSTDSYEIVAFNFAYFWQAGTDLGQFPPIFGKYYQELMNATEQTPSGRKIINQDKTPEDVVVEYNNRTMQWYYWKELPANTCFVFCFTEADDLQVSPFVSLLLQAQDLASYSLLQQQLLSVPLYSMLTGEIPLNDKNKSGAYLDDYALSPESVNLFEAKANNLMPPGTSYVMVPSKNNQLHHFQEIPNANGIYNTALQQVINTSGASTLITTTEKPSVAQVNAGKIIETRFIDRLYEQFAWAVDIILRDMYDEDDLKYHWNFKIFGDSFSEKERISAIEKSLSMGQTELLPEYLALNGLTLMDAVNNADWVESSEIYDKFKIIQTSFTSNAGAKDNNTTVAKQEGEAGRKQITEDKIENDSTAASYESGTNVER